MAVAAEVGSGLELHSTNGLLSLGCTPRVTLGSEGILYHLQTSFDLLKDSTNKRCFVK